MDFVFKLKAGIVAICAALTAAFGYFGWLIVGLVFLESVDYFTGWMAARHKGEWSSKKAKTGLSKKVGILIIVAIGIIVDLVIKFSVDSFGVMLPIDYTLFVSTAIATWYLLAEIGSIVENVTALGTKMPPFLGPLIHMLKATIERTGSKLVEGKARQEEEKNVQRD